MKLIKIKISKICVNIAAEKFILLKMKTTIIASSITINNSNNNISCNKDKSHHNHTTKDKNQIKNFMKNKTRLILKVNKVIPHSNKDKIKYNFNNNMIILTTKINIIFENQAKIRDPHHQIF